MSPPPPAPVASTRRPPAVILVRPREEGNVGSACRAMANMGLSELVLVAPVAEIGPFGRAMAKGAEHVLDGSRRCATLAEAAAPFQRLVGTTSARARSGAPSITSRELPAALAGDPPGTRAALVFGPEVSGLANEELALCHPLVNVPCDPVQPTLNLSQAVLILAYELYLDRVRSGTEAPAVETGPGDPPADLAQVEGLFAQGTELLRRAGFARDDTFANALRDLRRLVARAAPTEREVLLLRGAVRRIGHAVGRSERTGEADWDG